MSDQDSVIKKILLDVLKPHEPSIIEFAAKLVSIDGVNDVNVTSVELDQNTESIKILITGDDVNLEGVKSSIEELGAVIHSVDEVTVTRKLV